ncbi:MAG TPA: hypothetical protein VNT55_02205, partial [Baekduia sp.]|nr:hypothetical protein [Baekduia sp.]
DDAWLATRREALGEPLSELDPAGALETLRLERDAAIAGERVDAALREAQALEDRAADLPTLQRRARRDLADEAATLRAAASTDLDEIGNLHDHEQDLRDHGRHLDTWWERHADDAAAWIAIEQELAHRHETEIEAAEERDAELDHVLEPELPEPPELEL